MKTRHALIRADARSLEWIPDESVHLVVTSPPYWNLVDYGQSSGQLGAIRNYDVFLKELDKVWRHCSRVILPGGRLVCVVGDVCLARRTSGRHLVVPLHSDLQVAFRRFGLDNLTPILWHKITNGHHEVKRGAGMFGRPFEPNGIIKNEVEYVLMARKPGRYRSPSRYQRIGSFIPKATLSEWYSQIWLVPGAVRRGHPAPFPMEIARRLIRMFSFCGDIVLDPFAGTGTTVVSAMECGRNSIGVELDCRYFRAADNRIRMTQMRRFGNCSFLSMDRPPVTLDFLGAELATSKSTDSSGPLPAWV